MVQSKTSKSKETHKDRLKAYLKELEEGTAKELGIPIANVCVVGSTQIVGEGNDVDFLVLTGDVAPLISAGYVSDENHYGETPFESWRKGRFNVIVTEDFGFYMSEIATAFAAKMAHASHVHYNFKNRGDRVGFHALVRDATAEKRKATLDYKQVSPTPRGVSKGYENRAVF